MEQAEYSVDIAYSLGPKKNDVLGFKICPKKNDILLNLACLHVHVGMQQLRQINRDNRGHFTFLIICPKISRMTFFWTEGVVDLVSDSGCFGV
jgi:hypothetical protein